MGEWYKRARVRAESVADLRQAGYAEADAFRNRPDHLDLMTECSDASPTAGGQCLVALKVVADLAPGDGESWFRRCHPSHFDVQLDID